MKRLLIPAERDAAFREIFRWQRYRGEPRYRVTEAETIHEVKVSPQPEGLPVYVVLFDSPVEEGRHYELIDGDGTFLSCYQGNNVLSGALQDINRDGTIEVVDPWGCGFREQPKAEGEPVARLDLLHVVPITRDPRPLLIVAYNRSRFKLKEMPFNGPWFWELKPGEGTGVVEVVLGPKEKPGGTVRAEAVYRWSREEKRFIGPAGGQDQPYLRADGLDWDEVERFAAGSIGR